MWIFFLDRIQPLLVSCVDQSFITIPKGVEDGFLVRGRNFMTNVTTDHFMWSGHNVPTVACVSFLHPFEPHVCRFRLQHKPLSPSPTLRVLMYHSIPSTTRTFISNRYRNPSQPLNPSRSIGSLRVSEIKPFETGKSGHAHQK